ncbi:MAG: class II aldolase/adducin family protein [Fibrobacteres bacterium]|nr:class II aldolase/adducin family protein [Fibrobacterota bacterium]
MANTKFTEGYIKFKCNWSKGAPVSESELSNLQKWRDKLYQLKLIGAYDNGIGYGNISERGGRSGFVITGSATGNAPKLSNQHYTQVEAWDFKQNSLLCSGPIQASSESLSHAVIYETSPETGAVIHIHNKELWQQLMNKVPTTDPSIEYGTPEMAFEIARLFRETDVSGQRILVMAGHEEGIISFGKDLDEAGETLLALFLYK